MEKCGKFHYTARSLITEDHWNWYFKEVIVKDNMQGKENNEVEKKQ